MYTLFFTMGPSTHHPLSPICELSSSMDVSAFPVTQVRKLKPFSATPLPASNSNHSVIIKSSSSVSLAFVSYYSSSCLTTDHLDYFTNFSIRSQSLDISSFIHPLPVIFLVSNLIVFFPCLKTFPGSFWSTT